MNRKRILAEIFKAEKNAQNSNPNISNFAMNRLSVLKLMLNRWDYTDFYDDETDFNSAYENMVDEIIESEFGLKNLKEKLGVKVLLI